MGLRDSHMHLPWGFVLVHYSQHWTAQLAAGGWSEHGLHAFMRHFEPVDIRSNAFAKANWLVASIPKLYWPEGESVFSAKEMTSGECVEILDRALLTMEPALGSYHFNLADGCSQGTLNMSSIPLLICRPIHP